MSLEREIELLTEQTKSPDRMVRMKAIVMLVNKGSASILPTLEKLAAKDESVEIRYYARKAMGLLAQRPATPPARPANAPAPDAGELAPAQGASEALADRPPPTPDRQEPARPPSPISCVRPAATESGVRAAAAGAAPRPIDVEAVRRGLVSNQQSIRIAAVKAALAHELTEIASDIGHIVFSEADPVVLSAFAIALGKLGGTAHSGKLVRLLSHADARVRANAIEGLEMTGDGAVYPFLIAHLRDEDNRCRANAARALRVYGPVNQLSTLRLMLESDEVWMQDSAAYVLGFITDPRVFHLFKIALGSQNKVVREQARSSLQRLKEKGSERAADMLARIGGERHGMPEEELFQRLHEASADAAAQSPEAAIFDVGVPHVPIDAAPPPAPPPFRAKPPPQPPPVQATAPARERPSLPTPAPPPPQPTHPAEVAAPVAPPTPPTHRAPAPPSPEPRAVPAPIELAVPVEIPTLAVALPEAAPEVDSRAEVFYQPAARTQTKRKSAEEALAGLSDLGRQEIVDLDFIAKDELRQDDVFTRLTSAASASATDAADLTRTASWRAARTLEVLTRVSTEGGGGELPHDREEARMARARSKLEQDLAGLPGARTKAEVYKDKTDREDGAFERLRALSG